MSQVLHTQPERDLMQSWGDLNKKLIVPKGGFPRSTTPQFIVPILKKMINSVGGVIGAAIVGSLTPFLGHVGYAVGFGLGASAQEIYTQNRILRRLTKQLPDVSDKLDKWQRAVDAVNRKNIRRAAVGPSQAAVTAAAVNLNRALVQLHPSLSLQNIARDFSPQGSINPTTAQPDQQKNQKSELPVQREGGGAVKKKTELQERAHGGVVGFAEGGDVNDLDPVVNQQGAPLSLTVHPKAWYEQQATLVLLIAATRV
jgi:hypothetical protein